VITERFDSRVFLIDTGMLKSTFGGKASALEIHGGRFTAYYPGEKPQGLVAPPAASDSVSPSLSPGKPPQ
jgi:hypothetical protein